MKNGLIKKIGRMLAVPILALSIGSASLVNPKKAEAREGDYARIQLDYIRPLDEAGKDIYGGLCGISGQFGHQNEDNVRLSIGLKYSFGTGKPYVRTIGDVSVKSVAASLSNISLQARAAKVFDLGSIIPYIGGEISYNMIQETIKVNYTDPYQSDTLSGTARYSGLGCGLFAGIEIPNSTEVIPYIEALINHIPINNSEGAGKDAGGFSISAGVKKQF